MNSVERDLIKGFSDFASRRATYRVTRICRNCHHRFVEHVKKGKRVQQRAECPNCGCIEGIQPWPN